MAKKCIISQVGKKMFKDIFALEGSLCLKIIYSPYKMQTPLGRFLKIWGEKKEERFITGQSALFPVLALGYGFNLCP